MFIILQEREQEIYEFVNQPARLVSRYRKTVARNYFKKVRANDFCSQVENYRKTNECAQGTS